MMARESQHLINDAPHSSDEEDDDDDHFEKDIRIKHVSFHPETTPRDRWNMVYLIFIFYGIIIVMSWNFFVTDDGYWMYKFRDVNNTHSEMKEYRTELQTFFNSYMSIAATAPGVIFYLVNALISKKISHHVRLNTSLFGMIIVFIFTTVLTKIDTDKWQNLFFGLTIASIVLLNSCVAIFQGAVMGLASAFPSRFIQANMNGQAIGGIFAVLGLIITLACDFPVVDTGFIYFLSAVITLFFTIIVNFCLTRSLYYRYHMKRVKEAETRAEFNELIYGQRQRYFLTTFKRIFLDGYTGFVTFFCTLAVYPAISVLVVSINADNNTSLTNQYFIPVGCFLIFNLGDLTGRIVSGMLRMPSNKSVILPILSTIRLALIPMIMMCNVQPRHYFPLVFNSDVDFVLLMLTLGLTNGYFINLAAIYAPKKVEVQHRELAGSILAFFFGSGLAFGALVSDPLIRSV